MARKRLSTIPVQPIDMTAEFAGKQYEVNDAFNYCSNKKRTSRWVLFRDSIYRLLYSNFKWYGLELYEANAIENYLIRDGRVCAIKTRLDIANNIPDAIMFGRAGSNPNVDSVDFYGRAIGQSCTGYNGKIYYADNQNNFVIGFDTCAYTRNFPFTRPLSYYIHMLANELDDAYSAWKVAAETRKVGMVFQCQNKKTANVLRKVLSDIGENNPYIVIEGEIDEEVQTILTPPNISALNEFHLNFMNVFGFVLDMIGLENNSQNKKERLVVTEAELNRSLSRYISADRLKARKDFAEEMNQKFGTNIRVENYLASMVTENPEDANIEGEQEDITDDI